MTKTDGGSAHDFAHLCRVFRDWYDAHGLSQSKVLARGGPSKPKQSQLYNGIWTSERPSDLTDKIDAGFRWPPRTAWRVLTEGYDPTSDDNFVGGDVQPGAQYVASPGEQVKDGRADEHEVLRAITAMSASLDQLLAGQRDLSVRLGSVEEDRADAHSRFAALEAGQRELSERLAQLEKSRP